MIALLFVLQVYDRLNTLGMSLSYNSSLNLIKDCNVAVHRKLCKAIVERKQVSIVGDNINMKVGVRDERIGHSSKMLNYFGCAIHVNDFPFLQDVPSCARPTPTCFEPLTFVIDDDELDALANDYAHMMMKVAAEHINVFSFLGDHLEPFLTDDYTKLLTKKTEVLPLPVMPRDENKLEDVVQILKGLESVLQAAYKDSNMDITGLRIPTGGDQLTRERFTSGKLLLLAAEEESERFSHLSPIVSQLFHLAMNYLQLCFDCLFSEQSEAEIGTMYAEKIRICRKAVKADVKQAYDQDKSFMISFTNAWAVEAITTHFAILDTVSTPQVLLDFNALTNEDDKTRFLSSHFKDVVRKYVGTFTFNKDPLTGKYKPPTDKTVVVNNPGVTVAGNVDVVDAGR